MVKSGRAVCIDLFASVHRYRIDKLFPLVIFGACILSNKQLVFNLKFALWNSLFSTSQGTLELCPSLDLECESSRSSPVGLSQLYTKVYIANNDYLVMPDVKVSFQTDLLSHLESGI